MATEQKPKTQTQTVQKFQESTVELVLKKVNSLTTGGGLVLPTDYNAANSLRSAWLILQEVKDASKQPVLVACSNESISTSLFRMVVQGLNPEKKHCAFIARGGKLTCQTQYQGYIALAKRFGNVKDILGITIYEEDVFEYRINPMTGRREIIKHEQKMENIDETKIRGAYAVAIFNDGSTDMLPMTLPQIKNSWLQGELGGKGPAHLRFPSSMCEKTVQSKLGRRIYEKTNDIPPNLIPDEDEHLSNQSPLANAGPVVDIPEETEFQEVEEVVEPEPEKPKKDTQAKAEGPGF